MISRQMRGRVPDGWPGLVGIIVLTAGTAALLGRPGVSPLPLPADATGGFLGEFAFAFGSGPTEPLAIEGARDAYERSEEFFAFGGPERYAERHQSAVGLFPDVAAAEEAFSEVDLPDGTSGTGIDRLLLLIGLPTDEPIPDELRRAFMGAAPVLMEGDRGGEGSIVLDLRCTAPTAEAAAGMASALGDYGAAPYYAHLRPPWLGAPLTPDEELARATYRRWSQAYRTILGSDSYLSDWGQRFASAETAAERLALQDELNEHVRRRRPDLDGTVHPGVMALLASRSDDGGAEGYLEWGLALGRLMGQGPITEGSEQPTWFDQRHGGSIGSVRAVERSVEIGWASFNTFAIGGLGLFAYLDERGCDDVRVRVMDFDDVRGD